MHRPISRASRLRSKYTRRWAPCKPQEPYGQKLSLQDTKKAHRSTDSERKHAIRRIFLTGSG